MDLDQHVEAVLFPRDICDTYLLTQPVPQELFAWGKISLYTNSKIYSRKGEKRKEGREGKEGGREQGRDGRKKEDAAMWGYTDFEY